MYPIYKDGQLVAFRTFWADLMAGKHRFAWLSGSWVHPDYRRQGLSTRLLNAAGNDWNNMLAATNFAPNTQKLLHKTGEFRLLSTLYGKRYYLRSDFSRIIPARFQAWHYSGPLMKPFDYTFNLIIDFYKGLKEKGEPKAWFHQEDLSFQNDIWQFVGRHREKALFRNSAEEFEWVLQNPWMSNDPKYADEQKKYPFKLFSPDYRQSAWVNINHQGEVKAFVVLLLRNGRMDIPYCFTDDGNEHEAAKIVYSKALEWKATVLNIFQLPLLEAFHKLKPGRIYAKPMQQQIYIHRNLMGRISPLHKAEIQPGEGDAIFA